MRLPLSPGVPITVTLRVEGEKGFCETDAVLDTGALFVTIPTEVALDLGYQVAGAPRVTVATASGVVEAPKIILSRVSVGDVEGTDIAALCLDISAAGVSSLLGLSFLSRCNLAVDWKRQTLTITDP